MPNLSRRPDDELRGIAAEIALGVAAPADSQYLSDLAADGDEFALQEVNALQETSVRLAFAAPLAKPPAGLRARLLRRIHEPEAKKPRTLPGFEEALPGFHLLRAETKHWRATGHEGVDCMVISHDPATDALTTLLRLQAGASYPRHRHTKEEQCWVLAGDVRQVDGSLSMRAGDFFRAMPGTDHDPITSDYGCTLLIVGSAKDELL